MLENDELQIYRGNDYYINDKIIIHQPTIGEICDFGEQSYLSVIKTFTSIPVDYIAQLEDANLKYENMTDFELFILLSVNMKQQNTSILFGNIDFTKFEPRLNNSNNEVFLCDKKNEIIIDRYIYDLIVTYLRKSHNIKRNNVICGNLAMREYLIEEARDRMNNQEKFKSVFKPLISAMINTKEFKYGHGEIWDMKINAFMDSVDRIKIIKNYEQLMSGIYTGNIEYSKIDKSQLNWLKELD